MYFLLDFALVTVSSYVTTRFYVNMIMRNEWSLPTWPITLQTWLRWNRTAEGPTMALSMAHLVQKWVVLLCIFPTKTRYKIVCRETRSSDTLIHNINKPQFKNRTGSESWQNSLCIINSNLNGSTWNFCDEFISSFFREKKWFYILSFLKWMCILRYILDTMVFLTNIHFLDNVPIVVLRCDVELNGIE